MSTHHWTDDPVLAAAVTRLRELLAERGCYAATLRVTNYAAPEMVIQGQGAGEGAPDRTERGMDWWETTSPHGVSVTLHATAGADTVEQ